MQLSLFIFFSIILIFFTNNQIKKKKLLTNYNGEKHQKFIGQKNIPLTGGIYLILISFLIFFNFNKIFSFFLLCIFLIGLASDLKYLSSPKIRFLIQCFCLFIFTYIFQLDISPTRIYFLDLFLENFLLSCLFSTFCLLIVINGTNFVDGLNGLVLTYYLMILIIILKFGLHNYIVIDEQQLIIFALSIFIILLFNLSNQLYIGDSGAYLISFIISVLLINIYQNNQSISPFFIVLLLWYPCFENLFSIIRKFKIRRSPIIPDNKHFHQLFYNFLLKKFKLKKVYTNNLGSLIILLYNFLIFSLAIINIYNTQFQIFLILLNIFIYIFIYLRLFNYFYNSKTR